MPILINVRPDAPPWPHQPLQADIRRVDGADAGEEEHIVQPAAEGTAEEGRHHGNPEVIAAGAPDLVSVAEEIRHEARTEIAGEVDGVAGLPAETGADAEDDEEERQRRQVAGAEVAVVLERVDAEHQDGRRDELAEEHARLGHEGGRVGAEDAARAGVGAGAGHGARRAAAFVHVDGGFVVGVDDAGGAHGAQELREEVAGEFAEGEAPEDAVCQGDGRVEVRAGDAGGVDAEHDS